MNSEWKSKSVSILLGIVACPICLPAVQGQQAASSTRFGQAPLHTSSTAGATAPIHSGGGSSWGAGGGSFGSSVQPGGIWHDDGPSLGVAGGAGSSTQSRRTASSGLPSGGTVPSGFSISAPSNLHGTTGGVHSSHTTSRHSPGASVVHHGITSRAKGRGHGAAGSRWRVASLGSGSARQGTRRTSGVTTSMPRQSVTGNSQLGLGLDTGLPANGVGQHSQ